MPNKLEKGSKSKQKVQPPTKGKNWYAPGGRYPAWQDNIESPWNNMNGRANRPTATGKPQQFKRTMSGDTGTSAQDFWRMYGKPDALSKDNPRTAQYEGRASWVKDFRDNHRRTTTAKGSIKRGKKVSSKPIARKKGK